MNLIFKDKFMSSNLFHNPSSDVLNTLPSSAQTPMQGLPHILDGMYMYNYAFPFSFDSLTVIHSGARSPDPP